jgi:hypothetical protein
MATNSFIQVPPDSTGKKLFSKQHTVDAAAVQVQALHVADPNTPTHIQAVDPRGAASVRFTEGQPLMTSYGAVKAESERLLGVYEASLDTYDDLFSIVTANGGTSTYDAPKSSTVLATTTTSGSSVSRTTNRYHYYLPGTSNLARLSIACGDTGKVNNKRRWGVYDDNDGIFFELNGTELRVVVRGSTSGSVVDTPIPRSSWTDKLDGSGLSGLNIDITKVNNYWADYTFSGAGRVRFGVYEPDGNRLVAGTINVGNSSPYPPIRTGTLPFRTENINTGTTGSSSELREVVMSISTESDPKDYTFWRSADMEVYGVTVTTDTHLISLQSISTINSKHNSVQAYPEVLSAVVTGGPVAITLWQTVSISSPSWVVGSGATSIRGSTAGTLTLTNARKFATFFVDVGVVNIDMTPYFEVNDEGIMCQADGNAEVWSVTATRLTGNTTTVGVNLAYRELW